MSRKLVEEPLGEYRLQAALNGAKDYSVYLANAHGEPIDSDVVNLADAKARIRFAEERIPASVREHAGAALVRLAAKADAARIPFAQRGRNKKDAGHAYATLETPEQAVAALNREFAIVIVGDGPAVLQEGVVVVEGLPGYRLLSIEGFSQWLRPYTIDAAGKSVPIAKIWLDSDQRRQYQGLVFAPNEDAPGHYNLWRGFAVKPSERGSCQRFLDHVAENVCDGDEQHFAWVMGWLAHIIQHPGEKSGTSLALRGKQGVGKTVIGNAVGSLLGPHYKLVSEPRYVTGRFNSHLVDCLLLQLDEATWGGDHAATGRLKALITGQWHLVEFKGREPVRVRNHVRVLITSNEDWTVPAGPEERRFYVLDVSDRRMQDREYFAKLHAELDAGGRERLLRYLLDYQLGDVPLHRIASTPALLDQKLASLNSLQAWWLDTLRAGTLPGDAKGSAESPVNALYSDYIEHSKQAGERRRAIETVLGVFLRNHVPDLRRERRMLESGERTYVYVFPPLAVCRAQMDRAFGGCLPWPDPISQDQPDEWLAPVLPPRRLL